MKKWFFLVAIAGLLAFPVVAQAQQRAATVEGTATSDSAGRLLPATAPDAACDPSYIDVCIPPPPPDLDCGDIPERGFSVVGDDPHRFDRDHDGVGCEGG